MTSPTSEQEEHRTIRKNLLIAYAASVLSTVGGAISGVYTLFGLTGNNVVYNVASLLSVVGLYYIVVYIWISLQDWKSPSSTNVRNAMNVGFVLVALGGFGEFVKLEIQRGFGTMPLFYSILGAALHSTFALGIAIFGLTSLFAIRFGHVVLRGDPDFGHSPIPRPPPTRRGNSAVAGFFTCLAGLLLGEFFPIPGLGLMILGGVLVTIGLILRRKSL